MALGASIVEEPETDIVRRAMRGDPAAFGKLFQRYSRPILSFLFGMAGRQESAEDLMQETLSRAFLLLPNLRDEAKFSTWLFGIAKNVAREKLRQRVFSIRQVELDSAEANSLLDANADPEAAAMRQQLHQAICRGIRALEGDSRTVLSLRVFAEMKYEEIAEITGWSLPKVKSEIYRARLKMRTMMQPHLERKLKESHDAM
jgi:RNA polymerase sigma-70 factor (ECF subfamily)